MRFGPTVEIPDEIAAHIFSFLPLSSIPSVLSVSKEFQVLGDDNFFWKALAIRTENLSPDEVHPILDFRT